MITHDRTSAASALVVAAGLAFAAHAQWSGDPAQNMALADRDNDQTEPELVATADGGCYVMWSDNHDGNGYDICLQRLDAQGNELWPHNGLTIVDRTTSMNTGYGLVLDPDGNAVLAVHDDSSGSDVIVAQKVSPAGDLLWGASGVQVAGGSGSIVMMPDVTVLGDGSVVVGWTADVTVEFLRLGADGVPLWPAPMTLADPNGGVFWLGDLHVSAGDAFIVAWRRDGPMFWDPKHIWAQKFTSGGDPVWGPEPLVVYDGGSIQFGNFPTFTPDGSGGAIFTWYRDLPSQCYAQHIDANGVELFGHNGQPVSTNELRSRYCPAAAYDPGSGETFVFWTELWVDGVIDHWSVYGQKFDPIGARCWGEEGVALMELETFDRQQVRAVPCGDGAMVFWLQKTTTLEHRIDAARIDTDGNHVWSPSILAVSSQPTYRGRPSAVLNTDGVAFLAWSDGTIYQGDILAQNVNPDGTLGNGAPNPADINGDGVVDVQDMLALLAAWGATGGPEDINGDGVVDVLDLLDLFAAWT